MYKCDCDENGKQSHQYFHLIPTEVKEDGICVRCGNYARWVNPEEEYAKKGDLQFKKVTVFKLKEDEYRQFNDTHKASNWAGYSTPYAIGQKIKKRTLPCHSSTLGILIVEGHIDEIPEKYLKKNKPKKIYAFSYDKGELLGKGTIKYLSKKFGESEEVITRNLARESIKTKKGVVYSKKPSFDLEGYKRAMELPTDFDAPKWRQDVIDYEESELGVTVETDNYGTWKELLYS